MGAADAGIELKSSVFSAAFYLVHRCCFYVGDVIEPTVLPIGPKHRLEQLPSIR